MRLIGDLCILLVRLKILHVDINECLLDYHDCLSSQRCDNTIGSYTCFRTTSCGTGYTYNSQKSRCEGEKLNDDPPVWPNEQLIAYWDYEKTTTNANQERTIAPFSVLSISAAIRRARSGASASDALIAQTGSRISMRRRATASNRHSAPMASNPLPEADAMV